MMEMKPEERLRELIQLFHQEKVVETLVEAQRKGGFIDLQTTYAEEKKKFFGKLQELQDEVENSLKRRSYFIDDPNYKIYPEDSLQICLICMMSNISEINLLRNWYQVVKALKKVEGIYSELANRFIKFLSVEKSCKGENFTSYNAEELLVMFFG